MLNKPKKIKTVREFIEKPMNTWINYDDDVDKGNDNDSIAGV